MIIYLHSYLSTYIEELKKSKIEDNFRLLRGCIKNYFDTAPFNLLLMVNFFEDNFILLLVLYKNKKEKIFKSRKKCI